MILGDRKGRDVLVFIDDTSIGTETEEKHLESLESVLDLLFGCGVRLKLSKCEFGVRRAEILGHMVDENGLRPSDKHVESIRALTEPQSGDELMRFLGLVNYFAGFIDHYAESAAPLYDVLKGTGFSKKRRHGQRFLIADWEQRWGKTQTEAWKELKAALSDPQILAAPRRGAPKRMMTDASAYGLGGVLLQQGEDKKWRPISFTSRLLKKADRNYSPTERECLAVVDSLLKWRHYLHGEAFVAVTDHLSLKWLLSLQDPRERLARWVVSIQDFDFTVVPDALSRDAVPKSLCQRYYCPLNRARMEEIGTAEAQERVAGIVESVAGVEMIRAVGQVGVVGDGPRIEEFRAAQVEECNDLERHAADQKHLMVDDDGLRRSTKRDGMPMVVPRSMVKDVLEYVHGSRLNGHYKLQRILAKLTGRYCWKGMAKDTARFVKDCLQCTVSDDRQPPRQVELEVVHPKRRFAQVAFDIQTITPRSGQGNIKVVAFIDVFTRYVRAVPIKDEKAETIAQKLLDEWIAIFGPMETLLSDGGTNLVGNVVSALTSMLGIGRVQTYPLHPQANGTVERWNRTLARDIASFMTTGSSD